MDLHIYIPFRTPTCILIKIRMRNVAPISASLYDENVFDIQF